MKVYIIWDTRTNEQWSTGAKAFWKSAGAAKNALLNQHPVSRYDLDHNRSRYNEEDLDPDWFNSKSRSGTFKDQTRFECWECAVIRTTMV